jgi:DNA helicase-2/ATP-dependent DNA helicase PcrA
MRALYLTFARRRSLYGATDWNLPSRFIEEIPAELTDRPERQPLSAPSTWGRSDDQPERAVRRQATGASFSIGDDVVHAQFGEGVVTGMDAGGRVIVRFASDGSERKLMADYAPLKKR